ncbi:MAG: recombinase family protein [Candidatus Komeilibacteria bacterium]
MQQLQQNPNNTVVRTASPIQYCLYARKSTESDELQALSIDSQIKEMLELAKLENMEIKEIRRESHSAKDSGQRPIFNQLLADVREGMFSGILCWAPDRLSRNAGDLGSVVDLMDQGRLQEIRTHGQKFTNNPNEKFLLMILGSQAKLENDHKGINVKRGLRAKCKKGWRPGKPPLGYFHDKYADKGDKKVFIDNDRATIIKEAFELVAYEGYSGRDLYKWMNDTRGFRTRKNKKITLSMIYRMLKESFYYGEFEYPVDSGKFYKGKHDPIITEELFLKVRDKMSVVPKRHPGTVDFAFTKLLYCGACGSGITAEEKFKHQQNGNVHRYVYYHCTCGKNRECKQPAIREEDLIKQMVLLIDEINIDKLKTVEKIKKEIQRFQKFNYIMSGNNGDEMPKKLSDVNIKNYAKYILLEGTKQEKRDLLECLKSKLILINKTLKYL